MAVKTTLRADAESASAARRFVADVLSQRGFPMPAVENAMLLATEIFAFALGAGGDELALKVMADPSMGRIELQLIRVAPTPSGSHGLQGPTGARLQVLQALAEAWGVEEASAGPCVWFEVRA